MRSIVQQIQGVNVAEKKFPFLINFQQYRYPPKISLEQASSQATAVYKSSLMNGKSIIDMTGGMGIDTYYFSLLFENTTYLEPNIDLFNISKYNFEVLKANNIDAQSITCETYLDKKTQLFDWVYIDPSRRISGNRKTSIHNYEPNIVTLKDDLLKTGKNVMIKMSPMQDISECIKVLGNVSHVWIVSNNNEVKELLIQIGQEACDNPKLTVKDVGNKYNFEVSTDIKSRRVEIENGPVKKYIYQPYSSIVKAELQNSLAAANKLYKIHNNTQLFTSDILKKKYLGRIFEVEILTTPNRKLISTHLRENKANIITKNFPLSPKELAKKLKLKDGGSDYLLAFTDFNEKKRVAICNRIQ